MRFVHSGCEGAAAIVALILVAGCGVNDTTDPAAVVEDSAGVSIVTSIGQEWQTGEEWRLGSEPELVLGGAAAPEGEELWRVRALARAPDGRIAVILGADSEVRVHDSGGERVAAFGRSGGGPGEFEVPPYSIAIAPPDTAIVMDRLRVHTFLLDGTWLQSEPLRGGAAPGAGTQIFPSVVLRDRSVLGVMLAPGGPAPEGVYRPETGFAVYPSPQEDPVLLGWYGGIEQQRIESSGGNIVAPFARRSTATAGGASTRFVVGDNERYEIHVFDASGSLRQVVRRDEPPIPVRPEWVEAWKYEQRQADWTRGQLPELERGWLQMTVRETLPAFDALHVDAQGHLWVRRVAGVVTDSLAYDVFAPEGQLLGAVSVPGGLQTSPVFISDDRFIGVWTDDMNVESVRAYALHKPR